MLAGASAPVGDCRSRPGTGGDYDLPVEEVS
jgi:hypothetical protein